MYSNITIMSSCHICCEDFNNSTRKKITCPNQDCELEACKECVRKYICNIKQPCCMNDKCKANFDLNFMVMNLDRAFVEGEYRKHRKSLLTDREMARMPETMPAAERWSTVNAIVEENKVLDDKMKDLRLQIRELEITKARNNNRIYNLNRGRNVNGEEEEKRKFIMPCADPDCRGYLSTAWKCSICKMFTCPHCIEIIGPDKNVEHTCDEEKVKTAELIKSTTKPCPGCGERINKISGCDQMWCTQCHVAFSWKTGVIDKGVVHNPHFYQHQRNGGGAPIRNPGEVMCGGMPNFWQFRNTLLRKCDNTDNQQYSKFREWVNYLAELHRTFVHIQHYELQNARQKIREYSDFEDYRIRYILKQISKKDLTQAVFRKDNLRNKYTELVHIYELAHVVSVDLFRWIEHYTNTTLTYKTSANEIVANIQVKIDELESLRNYVNEQLSKVSISYNQKVPQFAERTWAMTSKKFSLKKAKKLKNENIKISSNEFTETGSVSSSSSM